MAGSGREPLSQSWSQPPAAHAPCARVPTVQLVPVTRAGYQARLLRLYSGSRDAVTLRLCRLLRCACCLVGRAAVRTCFAGSAEQTAAQSKSSMHPIRGDAARPIGGIPRGYTRTTRRKFMRCNRTRSTKPNPYNCTRGHVLTFTIVRARPQAATQRGALAPMSR